LLLHGRRLLGKCVLLLLLLLLLQDRSWRRDCRLQVLLRLLVQVQVQQRLLLQLLLLYLQLRLLCWWGADSLTGALSQLVLLGSCQGIKLLRVHAQQDQLASDNPVRLQGRGQSSK
jgi:hypothetical protein